MYFEYFPETIDAETILAIITPYLSQFSLLKSSLSEKSTEVSVKSMKDEEKRMEEELQLIQDDDERLKYETSLLTYREKRIELARLNV